MCFFVTQCTVWSSDLYTLLMRYEVNLTPYRIKSVYKSLDQTVQPNLNFLIFLHHRVTLQSHLFQKICENHEECMEKYGVKEVVCFERNGTHVCATVECKSDFQCPQKSICQKFDNGTFCTGKLKCRLVFHPPVPPPRVCAMCY